MSSFTPSASRFSSPNFPPEIINLIIQNKCLNYSDLFNTSLVSYVWKEASQRRLFSSVRLDPEMDHTLYNITPDSNSASPVRYIKHLTLYTTSLKSWKPFPCDGADDALIRIHAEDPDPEAGHDHDDYFNGSTFIGTKLGCTRLDLIPNSETVNSTHPKFPPFLHRLSKLERLSVYNRLNFYVLPREALQAFFHIFGLDSFHSLDIWRGAGLRLPFSFLHFCPNIEFLSLNIWPTTNLELEHLRESDYLALHAKPTVRPTVLKMISSEVVHSWSHYIGTSQNGLGLNPISLDRLRALYIAYDEDPSDIIMRGSWPSTYIADFLSSFGHNLEELVLEVDHRQSILGRLSPLSDATAPVSIPASSLSSLTNLADLRLNVYSGPLPEVSFNGGLRWLLLLLQALPDTTKITTFQLHYVSTFKRTRDLNDKMYSGEEFLEQLFEILRHRFSGLKTVKIQMKLTSLNGPSSEVLPVYELTSRSDYIGMVALKDRGVHTRLRVVLNSSWDAELE